MAEAEGGGRLKVAVIGAGGIARSVHLPSLAEMDDVRVVAVCDIIESRAREQAEKHDIPRVYTLYQEMLAAERGEVDAVFALVEPGNLFHVVWHALDAGYPVFMEKPPGVNLYQCESLARKSAESGCVLQVGFNRRFIPLVRRVKELLAAQTTINQVEGCFFKYGSGAFDRGSVPAFESDVIHAVDLVRWFAGGEPTAAATVAGSSDEDVINRWSSVFRFDNGVTGIIKGNYRTGGRVHKFEVHGAAVSAYINLGFGTAACEATILRHQGEVRYSLTARGEEERSVERLDGYALAGGDAFHRYYGFYFEDRHFLDCVRDGTVPETSIADAVKSMKLAHMISTSTI
ncbi:MAG TPA: Gfo/Idh/MocA family oxidoreductase [Phycisphaerae bacterium]|nr:Gfo/Idh/MocA family oxidoreductase [Phycisphaerae bacterium]